MMIEGGNLGSLYTFLGLGICQARSEVMEENVKWKSQTIPPLIISTLNRIKVYTSSTTRLSMLTKIAHSRTSHGPEASRVAHSWSRIYTTMSISDLRARMSA